MAKLIPRARECVSEESNRDGPLEAKTQKEARCAEVIIRVSGNLGENPAAPIALGRWRRFEGRKGSTGILTAWVKDVICSLSLSPFSSATFSSFSHFSSPLSTLLFFLISFLFCNLVTRKREPVGAPQIAGGVL